MVKTHDFDSLLYGTPSGRVIRVEMGMDRSKRRDYLSPFNKDGKRLHREGLKGGVMQRELIDLFEGLPKRSEWVFYRADGNPYTETTSMSLLRRF